jgi:hypothetical protein
MLVRAPLVQAERDGSIRVEDLTPVSVPGGSLGDAKSDWYHLKPARTSRTPTIVQVRFVRSSLRPRDDYVDAFISGFGCQESQQSMGRSMHGVGFIRSQSYVMDSTGRRVRVRCRCDRKHNSLLAARSVGYSADTLRFRDARPARDAGH